jgi:hypothetical protein
MANSSNQELGNIEHCNGKKIHLCKFQMHVIFMGKELLGIVDRNEVEPTIVEVAQAYWKKCDNQVTSLMCQTISKKYVEYVIACDITHVIWDKVSVIQE